MDSAKILELKRELKLFPYKEYFPELHESVFVASGAKIIGRVEIGENSSIWYNTVVRGDVHYIKIGAMTNVQDCSMLHVTNGKFPLNIGSRITIGHSVTLHGCTLHDQCLIGMGAIVLDGAVVSEISMVAAGAVIRPGFIVPSGKLAGGVPAKIIRDLTAAEIKEIKNSVERYVMYKEITEKSLENY